MQLRLMRRSLRISRPEAVQALRAGGAELPPLFTRSSVLRGALPLRLTDGQATLRAERGTLILTLDPELGLVVARGGG